MIDTGKLGRLRSLVLVCRDGSISPQVVAERQRHLLLEVASLLGDVAEVVLGSGAAAPAAPPRETLPKKSPYKSFAEDAEWHKDRALTLLRHLAGRPGSAEVREAVEAFLKELGLEGKPAPAIGRLSQSEAGPRELMVAHCQPLDERSIDAAEQGGILVRSATRAARKAVGLATSAPAEGARRAEAPPEHSRNAYDLGRIAGERGEGPGGNPFHAGARGIIGSRRIWWERARARAAWAREKRSGTATG